MCAGCTGCLPPVDGGWLPACAVQSDLHSLDAHAIQELREDPGVALDGCPIVPHCGQAKLAGPAGASEGRRWQGGGVSGWHCRLRRGRIECRRTRRASMYAAVTSTHSCSAAGNRDQSVMKVANPPWLRPPSASYTILVCVSRNACESSVSTAHEWVHRRRSSNLPPGPFRTPKQDRGWGLLQQWDQSGSGWRQPSAAATIAAGQQGGSWRGGAPPTPPPPHSACVLRHMSGHTSCRVACQNDGGKFRVRKECGGDGRCTGRQVKKQCRQHKPHGWADKKKERQGPRARGSQALGFVYQLVKYTSTTKQLVRNLGVGLRQPCGRCCHCYCWCKNCSRPRRCGAVLLHQLPALATAVGVAGPAAAATRELLLGSGSGG